MNNQKNMKIGKEEIIKRLEELSEEEFINYCKSLPQQKYFRLSYSFEVVMKLLDFINVINKHSTDLQWPGNKKVVEATNNFKPSQCLYEFIILEISTFYTNASQHLNEGFPEIPHYWEILKKFRDAMPGHRDNKQQFKIIADWMSIYRKVDNINSSGIERWDSLTEGMKGMDKIMADFKNYFKELKIRFPNDI